MGLAKSSPERGGGRRSLTEGPVEAGLSLSALNPAAPGPSVAPRHLPVPGRIFA
jgi:hypothetical protein